MNKYYRIILLLIFAAYGCRPEAKWTTETDVQIKMDINIVSAGYVECTFSTNKDTYYLIAIEEARENYDPITHQKQFMMLALDSANVDYLAWRNNLYRKGEFNVASFASHSLQYGTTKHYFTGLYPDRDYWVYAFVVNPITLEPVGKLNLVLIHTTEESIVDIHFEYRVKGNWDYIYPVDSLGNILSNFPYIATTRDSLERSEYGFSIPIVLINWMAECFINPQSADPHYGVTAMENDGDRSHLVFEEGHTYYTGICGFDGLFKQATIYKFVWNGEDTQYLFVDTDSANIINGDWELE